MNLTVEQRVRLADARYRAGLSVSQVVNMGLPGACEASDVDVAPDQLASLAAFYDVTVSWILHGATAGALAAVFAANPGLSKLRGDVARQVIDLLVPSAALPPKGSAPCPKCAVNCYEADELYFRVRYQLRGQWYATAMFSSLVDAVDYVDRARQRDKVLTWRIFSSLAPGPEPLIMGYRRGGTPSEWDREPCAGDDKVAVYPLGGP
jgi:phage tail protein X